MDFSTELKKRTAGVEEIIMNFLPAEEGYAKTIMSAMNYSVMAGGKRLRPLLMAETYKLFAVQDGNAPLIPQNPVLHRFMAAIELIHNYSLVHDDILDHDEYRRGKKTTHAVYGDDMGLLAGDALLNYAFETAAGAFEAERVCEACMLLGLTSEAAYMQRIAKALQVLSKKAGIYGMIGGQTCDVEDEGKEITKDELDFIQEGKTGALIEAAMLVGAILAGASDEDLMKVEAAASGIGRAFQIRDDILDVTGDEAVLGKHVGSDEENHKVTYVTFEGLEKAEADVKSLSEDAILILNSFANTNDFLTETVQYLTTREM